MPGPAGGSICSKARDRLRLSLRRAIAYSRDDQPHSGLIDDRQANQRPGPRDAFITVDGAWLSAGVLRASTFLGDPKLFHSAAQLYNRDVWKHRFEPRASSRRPGLNRCCWDCADGGTVAMSVFAAGPERCPSLDRIGPDMVGIDAGAAVIALDNVPEEDRVRAVFHALPCVERGLYRAGYRDETAVRRAS